MSRSTPFPDMEAANEGARRLRKWRDAATAEDHAALYAAVGEGLLWRLTYSGVVPEDSIAARIAEITGGQVLAEYWEGRAAGVVGKPPVVDPAPKPRADAQMRPSADAQRVVEAVRDIEKRIVELCVALRRNGFDL